MNEWVKFMGASSAQQMIWTQQSVREKPTFVLTAVVDSGCDIEHPSLADSITDSRSFQKTQGVFNSKSSHGTQSCGLVAGSPGGDGKFPGGMAQGIAKLLAIRYNAVVDVEKDATMYRDVARMGARIISNSFGFPGLQSKDATTLRDDAFSPFEGDGGIVIFAAGNESGSISLNKLPMAKHTILVAATGVPDGGSWIKEGKLASSNYGPGITVCALAGGVGGGKAVSTSNRGDGDATIDRSRDFDYHTDTSGACALVAGVVALMLRANPELTPKEVKTILCLTADKVDPNRWGDREGAWKRANQVLTQALLEDLDPSLRNRPYSAYYGFGRVNAAYAVQAAYKQAGIEVDVPDSE